MQNIATYFTNVSVVGTLENIMMNLVPASPREKIICYVHKKLQ